MALEYGMVKGWAIMEGVEPHVDEVQYWTEKVARLKAELQIAEYILGDCRERQEDSFVLLRGLAKKVRAQEKSDV